MDPAWCFAHVCHRSNRLVGPRPLLLAGRCPTKGSQHSVCQSNYITLMKVAPPIHLQVVSCAVIHALKQGQLHVAGGADAAGWQQVLRYQHLRLDHVDCIGQCNPMVEVLHSRRGHSIRLAADSRPRGGSGWEWLGVAHIGLQLSRISRAFRVTSHTHSAVAPQGCLPPHPLRCSCTCGCDYMQQQNLSPNPNLMRPAGSFAALIQSVPSPPKVRSAPAPPSLSP